VPWLAQGMRSGWIEITSHIDKNRDGPSKTGSVTIGSEHGDADVRLEAMLYAAHPENLSSKHARFEEDGDTGKLFIEDLQITVRCEECKCAGPHTRANAHLALSACTSTLVDCLASYDHPCTFLSVPSIV
jgi:hypothetical protein